MLGEQTRRCAEDGYGSPPSMPGSLARLLSALFRASLLQQPVEAREALSSGGGGTYPTRGSPKRIGGSEMRWRRALGVVLVVAALGNCAPAGGGAPVTTGRPSANAPAGSSTAPAV